MCYAELTESPEYIEEAQKRWLIYKKVDMTSGQNHVQLSIHIFVNLNDGHTDDPEYLEDAHRIK